MKKISVIIPLYCEETTIEECYKRLVNTLCNIENYTYELIFVNDGSTDNSLKLLNTICSSDTNVKVLSFSRNFGHQASIAAGLKEVTGDAIIIIDADLQDPPELIPNMLKYWEEGNEVIYGKREKRNGETTFKLLTAKLFYKIFNDLSDTQIPIDTGDFRLVDRKIVDIINSMPEHNKFLRGLFSWVGFKQIPYEYERQKRFSGKTKFHLNKMLNLAIDGIISFSKKPLKIIGYLGISCIILSSVFLLYTLLSYVFNFNFLQPCYTIIIFAIIFFSGLQLCSLWIVSEYIGRIYDQTQNRPEYIIEKRINF